MISKIDFRKMNLKKISLMTMMKKSTRMKKNNFSLDFFEKIVVA